MGGVLDHLARPLGHLFLTRYATTGWAAKWRMWDMSVVWLMANNGYHTCKNLPLYLPIFYFLLLWLRAVFTLLWSWAVVLSYIVWTVTITILPSKKCCLPWTAQSNTTCCSRDFWDRWMTSWGRSKVRYLLPNFFHVGSWCYVSECEVTRRKLQCHHYGKHSAPYILAQERCTAWFHMEALEHSFCYLLQRLLC